MEQLYRLNRVFRVTLSEPLTIEFPLSRQVFECNDLSLIKVVALLSDKGAMRKSEIINLISDSLNLSETDSLATFNLLKEIELIKVNKPASLEEQMALHWKERGWHDAFYLHCFSKDINYDDDYESLSKTNLVRKDLCSKIEVDKNEIWERPSFLEEYKLIPASPLPQDRDFFEILLSRRSSEPWKKKDFSEQDISNILFESNKESFYTRNMTEECHESDPESLLNYSSFTCLESKILILKEVGSLRPGLYHYDIQNHSLLLLKRGVLTEDLVQVCIGQKQLIGATMSIILVANWKKYFTRYKHPRAYRNMFVNAGELAQKYLLLATTLKMSQFITPAFDDKKADALIGTNGYESAPIYSITLG